ncbi:hypothetical protein COCSADRAFT_198855 [Bipolaris sorokiniana ND90Pr]|uniref:RING-type domain-containing protein n=1 Tax=Cochliobolus sativus (strain ND90Pr / ATCC 201652) TaxID=665912 RepID=M2TAY6_COCSN|nr:uncharacterized protein COCSADRAFT_198855 [Bipolaris sorokiniana ND90Pr]EMD66042.1 hypothetical protein COCSADRAFT_198855 [Bipolaris sorokiniana ND90Pr]
MFFHQHHRHSAQILPLETMPENEHESAFDEALRQAMQIGVELKNEIERLENHSPQLILFEGTLLFYLEALLLLSSLPNESKRSSGDFVDILRQCGSKRRNARLVAQQTPDSWAGGFPQLTLALQGYSHTIICFVFIKVGSSINVQQQVVRILSTMGTYYSTIHLLSLYNGTSNLDQVHPASENAIQALPKNVESVEDICGICLASMEIAKMPCNHQYHSECLSGWLGTANSCPNCRKKLPES